MRATMIRAAFVGALLLTTTAAARPRDGACGLIPAKEIERLQGAPLVQSKSSDAADRGFVVSQCFYQLEEFNRSVSLVVTRGDAAAPDAARRRWNDIFHGDTARRAGGGPRIEKKEGRPRPVHGVGDEAYWSGNAQVGALYVLKGDAYIRVSIGGGEPEETRIERSRALARRALRRL